MKNAAVLLNRFLDRKKATVPSYSMRALARDIKVSPSFLSEALAGKKRLAFDRIEQIAKVLDMDVESVIDLRQAYLPEEMQKPKAALPRQETTQSDYYQVSRREFKILRNWYYPVILDLTTAAGFGGTVEEIAERLSLHPETAAIAVRELVGSGLLVEENGKYRKSQDSIRFSASVPTEELRGFHVQMIDKAKAELNKTDKESWDKRAVTGITFTANPANLELARKKLADCLHEIADLLGQSDAQGGQDTEVYNLSAQLFPLTKPKQKA